LNPHKYYLQKEEMTMKGIGNSEPRTQMKSEEISDQNFFEKGNDSLVKDQIKTPASAVSGSQLIILRGSKNHENPHGTIIINRIEETQEREVNRTVITSEPQKLPWYDQSQRMGVLSQESNRYAQKSITKIEANQS
jgi:hypothetical protein